MYCRELGQALHCFFSVHLSVLPLDSQYITKRSTNKKYTKEKQLTFCFSEQSMVASQRCARQIACNVDCCSDELPERPNRLLLAGSGVCCWQRRLLILYSGNTRNSWLTQVAACSSVARLGRLSCSTPTL